MSGMLGMLGMLEMLEISWQYITHISCMVYRVAMWPTVVLRSWLSGIL